MIQSPYWWVFLALAPVAYWLLPARLRTGFLATISLALLAYFALSGLVVMALLAAFAYWAFRYDPETAPPWRAWLARSTPVVIVVLGYFVIAKYLPELAEVVAGRGSFLDFAVPLGVSYFAFKLLHYAIEMGRGNLPAHGPLDYTAWLFLAPTFTAGPIERFDHYLNQREIARFEARFLIEGGQRIVQGLVKKFLVGVMIAAALRNVTGGGLAKLLQNLEAASPLQVWIALLLTLAYVYMDFSAYSDIAIGSARLFGLRIMENFNFPFLATSLSNFWQRWHMTLAGFCRAYIYFPMIGLTRNPYGASVATFAVMGAWHAASPHWITWGVWHGVGLAAGQGYTRVATKRKWKLFKTPQGRALGWALTLAYVALGGSFTALYHVAGIGQSWRLVAKAVGLDL